jgi:hypothetical protein
VTDEWRKAGMPPIVRDAVEMVGEVLGEALRLRDERIAALEQRLAKLEESKRLSYRGVFAPAERYEAGDYVTHASSLWCCLRDTSDSPGRSASWRLAAKG